MYTRFCTSIWVCENSELGIAFAHSWPKTTTCWIFRVVFRAVGAEGKQHFLFDLWQYKKHGSTSTLWVQIGSRQPSGQRKIKATKTTKNVTVDWQSYCISILGRTWDYIHQLFWKVKDINSEYSVALLVHLKTEIVKRDASLECLY